MKILLTETQFKRLILKEDVPLSSEKKSIQNTKDKLYTSMVKLKDFFEKLLMVGRKDKTKPGKAPNIISSNYNKISKLIDEIDIKLKDPGLSMSLTQYGFSNWFNTELNRILNDIKNYKPLKKHEIDVNLFFKSVKGSDKYENVKSFDNKICCIPKDENLFNTSVDSFIENITNAHNTLNKRYENLMSESYIDGEGVNYIKDIDKSASDNEDLCDELTINSIEELKDKMRGMNISKDDRKKISDIIKKMKRDFNYLSADLDVANTYLRHIQNILCTYSKEDLKNVD